MHLRVHRYKHRYGLMFPARAYLGAVVVWPVVVVAAQDDLAACDETALSVKHIRLFDATSAHCERYSISMTASYS